MEWLPRRREFCKYLMVLVFSQWLNREGGSQSYCIESSAVGVLSALRGSWWKLIAFPPAIHLHKPSAPPEGQSRCLHLSSWRRKEAQKQDCMMPAAFTGDLRLLVDINLFCLYPASTVAQAVLAEAPSSNGKVRWNFCLGHSPLAFGYSESLLPHFSSVVSPSLIPSPGMISWSFTP